MILHSASTAPRRAHAWLVCLLLGCLLLPAALRAETYGDFTYTHSAGEITITGYPENASGTVSIPAFIDALPDMPVTTIAAAAFADCSGLTSVTIPYTVTTIGNGAFSGCSGLSSVTFEGAAPTTFGTSVFAFTDAGLMIAFHEGATDFTTPTWQGYQARILQAITFPTLENRPQALGSFAVSATSSSGLTVSLSVVSGSATVSGLTVTPTGPGVVTLRAEQAGNATYATAAPVERTFTLFGDFSYQIFNGALTLTGYNGAGGEVTIPDLIDGYPVTAIGDSAFAGVQGLTGVTLPASVTTIGNSAFAGCTNLTRATFEGNAPGSFGSSVFAATAVGFAITFHDTATGFAIPTWQGYPVRVLQSITFPTPLNWPMAYGSFDVYATSSSGLAVTLSVVSGPATVTGLTVTPTGPGVVTLRAEQAGDATYVAAVPVECAFTVFGDFSYQISDGALTITRYHGTDGVVTIPEMIDGFAVVSIGGHAFSGSSLTSVIIGDGVTTIGSDAFSWCSSLTSVTIGTGVTTIGYGAFSGTSLTSVTIPDNVTDIGGSAFANTDLTSVTIGKGVTTIGNGAFAWCSGLTSIVVVPENLNYASDNGVLFDKLLDTLILAPSGLSGSYTLPGGVITIGESAFFGCTGLTSVTLPESVTTIGDSAFSGCSGLTSATLGNGVTTIGGNAFSYCNGLSSLTLPNRLTTIGYWAFSSTGLTSITIPDSVTTIGDGAFGFCNVLASVTIGSGVTTIGSQVFYNCTALTSVSIPNSVTTIGTQAFSNSGLTSVTIGNGVTTISNGAFAWCSSLTSVTFEGNAPSTFGSNVFVFANPGLTISFYAGATDFSTPSWQGYPSVQLERTTTFATWIAAAGLSGPAAAPTADPDADGLPNLLEYALATAPGAATPAAQRPSYSYAIIRGKPPLGNQPALIYTHRCRVGATPVYTYKTSADLATPISSWTPVSVTPEVITANVDDDGLVKLVRVTVPLNGATRLFLALEVSE